MQEKVGCEQGQRANGLYGLESSTCILLKGRLVIPILLRSQGPGKLRWIQVCIVSKCPSWDLNPERFYSKISTTSQACLRCTAGFAAWEGWHQVSGVPGAQSCPPLPVIPPKDPCLTKSPGWAWGLWNGLLSWFHPEGLYWVRNRLPTSKIPKKDCFKQPGGRGQVRVDSWSTWCFWESGRGSGSLSVVGEGK